MASWEMHYVPSFPENRSSYHNCVGIELMMFHAHGNWENSQNANDVDVDMVAALLAMVYKLAAVVRKLASVVRKLALVVHKLVAVVHELATAVVRNPAAVVHRLVPVDVVQNVQTSYCDVL